MTLESLKSQENNEKNRQIRGKIIKSSMTFNENKANLSDDKFGAKHFSTRIYEISPACRAKKQTQSNPIQSQFKPNFGPISRVANPNKPKTNPKLIYPRMSQSVTQLPNRIFSDLNMRKNPQFLKNIHFPDKVLAKNSRKQVDIGLFLFKKAGKPRKAVKNPIW